MMTKRGFLQKLTDALHNLPAADRDNAIAYFTEQLDDRIEEGMTEAEAVDSLGDFNAIVTELLTASAEPAAAAAGAERGAGNRPEARSYTAPACPRTVILRETNCAVELAPSPDGAVHIEYEVTRWVEVSVAMTGDTLTYTARDIPHILHWDVIGRKPARLLLPQGHTVQQVELHTANSRIDAHDVTIPNVKLRTGNARLTLARMTVEQLDAKTANGSLTAEQLTVTNAALTTSQDC